MGVPVQQTIGFGPIRTLVVSKSFYGYWIDANKITSGKLEKLNEIIKRSTVGVYCQDCKVLMHQYIKNNPKAY